MSEIKKITVNIILLTISIFLISVNTFKELIYSVNKRRGNLLSIIFSLITEVVEEIFVFERSILSRSWMLQQKFIKRGLVIGAAFFFLLSSFEWIAADKQAILSAGTEKVQVAQEQVILAASNNDQSISVSFTANQGFIYDRHKFINQKYLYHYAHLPQKKYLIHRSFLI